MVSKTKSFDSVYWAANMHTLRLVHLTAFIWNLRSYLFNCVKSCFGTAKLDMKITVFAILLIFAAVAQCDDYSLLHYLSKLDLKQVIDGIFTKNLDDVNWVTRSRVAGDGATLRNREYDWEKCVADMGGIADGLNRTEMWAMQGA